MNILFKHSFHPNFIKAFYWMLLNCFYSDKLNRNNLYFSEKYLSTSNFRKIILIALLLSGPFNKQSIGQDIDQAKATVSYIKLPLKKLPEHVKVYFITVSALQTKFGNTLGNDNFCAYELLNGYHKNKNSGNVEINLHVTKGLQYQSIKEQVGQYTYREKKGAPEIKYYAYTYLVNYISPEIEVKMTDKSGNVIAKSTLGNQEISYEYGSSDYSTCFKSSAQLSNGWNQESNFKLAKQELSRFNETLAQAYNVFDEYCLQKSSQQVSIRYIDEKNKNEYADYREAKDLFMKAVALFAYDSIAKINILVQPNIEERTNYLKQAIAIWEKALTEANPDDKKARIDKKVERETYMNLAQAYLWLGNISKAKEMFGVRKKEKGSFLSNPFKGLERLENDIEDREKRLAVNNWRTTVTTAPVYIASNTGTENNAKQLFTIKTEQGYNGANVQSGSYQSAGSAVAGSPGVNQPLQFGSNSQQVTGSSGGYAGSNIMYDNAATEARMTEKIDYAASAARMDALIIKIAKKLNRFDLIENERITDLFKSALGSGVYKAEEDSVIDSYLAPQSIFNRKKVVILPTGYADVSAKHNAAITTAKVLCKNEGADFIIKPFIKNLEAKAIEAQGSSEGRKNYAGFEGEVMMEIAITDLKAGETVLLEKKSDKGVLKKGFMKLGGAVLGFGKAITEGKSAGEATLHGAFGAAAGGTLADQTMAKSKSEAVNNAIYKSELFIRENLGEQFAALLKIAKVEDKADKFILYVDGGANWGIKKGDKLDFVLVGADGKESKFDNFKVDDVITESNLSVIELKKKGSEKVKKAISSNAVMYAKLGIPKTKLIDKVIN